MRQLRLEVMSDPSKIYFFNISGLKIFKDMIFLAQPFSRKRMEFILRFWAEISGYFKNTDMLYNQEKLDAERDMLWGGVTEIPSKNWQIPNTPYRTPPCYEVICDLLK